MNRVPVNRPADRPRRAQVVRQRNRLGAQGRIEEVEEEQVDGNDEQSQLGDGEKIGAKKRAKLEAKAERKKEREMEEKLREEKKKREEQVESERKVAAEQAEKEEKRLEEERKRQQEEKERREHEEYLKMKEAFSVEEEGYEHGEEEDENSFQKFVNYIKDNKVIIIEDLAAMFKLKTQAVIQRIEDLQSDNILTGVMDDRGKYIYVSQEEMVSFASFIKQRGRVSISELVDGSNRLINLQPKQVVAS